MKKQGFEFHFDGPQAEVASREMANFLAKEFPGCTTGVQQRQPSHKAEGTRDAGTTVAIIALVFSLPGVTKNTLDVADRLKLKEKLTRLIAWAKERRARRRQNPFLILPPHGLKLPLDQAKPDQLLDAVTDPSSTDKSGKA